MTESQALAHYRRFNKKYFSSKLPLAIPIKFVEVPKNSFCGLTTMVAVDGLVLQAVYLDKALKDRDSLIKFSLLHEMVHVKQNPISTAVDAHGQEFEDEMIRLACRGAFKGIW